MQASPASAGRAPADVARCGARRGAASPAPAAMPSRRASIRPSRRRRCRVQAAFPRRARPRLGGRRLGSLRDRFARSLPFLPQVPRLPTTINEKANQARSSAPMIHATFSNLLAAWMLAIAICGWCCHTPAQSSGGGSTEIAQTKCCSPCPCSSKPTNDSSAPCNGSNRCQGACVYVPASGIQFDVHQGSAPLDLTWATDAPTVAASTASSLSLSVTRFDAGPPLRTHLLHQILLI